MEEKLEETQVEPQTKESAFKKHFMTVTPLSKYVAFTLFIAFPIAGFLVGVEYKKSVSINNEFVVQDISVHAPSVNSQNESQQNVPQVEESSLNEVEERGSDNQNTTSNSSETITSSTTIIGGERLFNLKSIAGEYRQPTCYPDSCDISQYLSLDNVKSLVSIYGMNFDFERSDSSNNVSIVVNNDEGWNLILQSTNRNEGNSWCLDSELLSIDMFTYEHKYTKKLYDYCAIVD